MMHNFEIQKDYNHIKRLGSNSRAFPFSLSDSKGAYLRSRKRLGLGEDSRTNLAGIWALSPGTHH